MGSKVEDNVQGREMVKLRVPILQEGVPGKAACSKLPWFLDCLIELALSSEMLT